MARMARLVVPGVPHHVTQRGNGRAQKFFSDADYAFYRDTVTPQGAIAEGAARDKWSVTVTGTASRDIFVAALERDLESGALSL